MFKKYFKMEGAGDGSGGGGGGDGSGGGGDGGAGDGKGGAPGVQNLAPGTQPVWTDAIADPETKNWVIAKGYSDLSALSRSAQNLEKLIGVPPERVIKLPTGDDPDAWKEVHVRLGMPKTAAEYVIKVPEGQDAKFSDTAKNWFHNRGLSQKQVEGITDDWNAYHVELLAGQKKTYDEGVTAEMAALKAEWGPEFDSRSALMEKAADDFGMTKEQLISLKIAMGPKAASNFLHKIGVAIPDPTNKFIDGEHENQFKTLTSAQAEVKLKALLAEPTFKKKFAGVLGEELMSEARAEKRRLEEIAYPGLTKI